jgi:hypothetical protein
VSVILESNGATLQWWWSHSWSGAAPLVRMARGATVEETGRDHGPEEQTKADDKERAGRVSASTSRSDLRARDEELTRRVLEHIRATVIATEAFPPALRSLIGTHVVIEGSPKSWGLTTAQKPEETEIIGWSGPLVHDDLEFTQSHPTWLVRCKGAAFTGNAQRNVDQQPC